MVCRSMRQKASFDGHRQIGQIDASGSNGAQRQCQGSVILAAGERHRDAPYPVSCLVVGMRASAPALIVAQMMGICQGKVS